MGPESIVSAWERYYDIALKCATSIKECKRPEKHLTICMGLIAEYFVADQASFISFANNSGIYRQLEIDGVEFQSWQAMITALSRTSVDSFMKQLADKWQDMDSSKSGDILQFKSNGAKPSHKFEHLKNAKEEIFPENLFAGI